jgi:hypothetical protein
LRYDAAMSNQDLHAALARLHTELQGMPALDEESRQLLAQITADIDRLRGSSADATHPARLESLAVRFEAAHPALAARLRGIADALGRVGV